MTIPILLSGCGACGSMEAKKKCACHAMFYCNETCQRADRPNHRKTCKKFLAAGGEAPDADDLLAWINLKKKMFTEAFKSQMRLDDQSKRGQLKDTVAIYFLRHHAGKSNIEGRFSFVANFTAQVDEMAKGPIIVGGTELSLERVGRDIKMNQARRLSSPTFDEPEHIGLTVFIATAYVGTELSPCCVHVVRLPLSSSELDSFVIDSDFEEVKSWFFERRHLFHEILVQGLDLFDIGNRDKIDDTVCVLNLEFHPLETEIASRFSFSRFVGCFAMSELGATPHAFTFEPMEWKREMENLMGLRNRFGSRAGNRYFLTSYLCILPNHPSLYVPIVWLDVETLKEDIAKGYRPDREWRERIIKALKEGSG